MMNLVRAAINGVRNEILSTSQSLFGGSSEALQSGSISTPSGKTVTANSSLASSVVFDCVRKNAQVIGGMPVKFFEKDSKGKEIEVNDGSLYGVLAESPNADQTAQEFWEGMSTQISLKGNAFAEKIYLGKELIGLQPLFGVQPMRTKGRSGFKYGVYDRGKWEVLPKDKVFHMRGFGAGDGLGMSTVAYGAVSIGAGLAADETASSIFSNAMMAAGVLSGDQVLNPEQRAQLQKMLIDFTGSSKAGKTLVLEAGLKWSAMQLNPEDAQLLETRRFSVEDICRWFGTPPVIVGHFAQGQTVWGTGVETILQYWLTLGINPLASRVEQRILKDLVSPEKRRRSIYRFDRDVFMQMDAKARAEFVSKMATSGTMTANERRERLGMQKHPDPSADRLFAQTAMAPLETLGENAK
ncbi:phage portal protein [Phaeobacter gallaeciensis]|uniref:phage portal protein n=1 Tax=Phaeobacter gallaeciensis TaxID=60890 RepID=UPI0003D6BB0D|nr:phage portal protein [Phaeobacter gallaeciensis]AHD12151.1 Phage-related protein [Phaeobacter gallaeciensis DSM 26640]ATE95335.1 Phage-related protein [Phaeobacter gallaeciensis]